MFRTLPIKFERLGFVEASCHRVRIFETLKGYNTNTTQNVFKCFWKYKLKRAIPGHFFVYFLSFQAIFINKNCRLKQHSKSDRSSE